MTLHYAGVMQPHDEKDLLPHELRRMCVGNILTRKNLITIQYWR